MLLQRGRRERRAQADRRSRAGLLQCPVGAVAAEDVRPLLLGRIGDGVGPGALDLRHRGQDLLAGKIGRPMQTSSGGDSAGFHFDSSKPCPASTLAPAGLTTAATERAMPSRLVIRSSVLGPLSASLAINSLPTPMPDARPISSETLPSLLVLSAVACSFPELAAFPPKSGCSRRAAPASRSGSWSGILPPSSTPRTRW